MKYNNLLISNKIYIKIVFVIFIIYVIYMTTRKNKLNGNGTKKCRPRQNELKVLCQQHANTFNQFEEEYENFDDERDEADEAKGVNVQ